MRGNPTNSLRLSQSLCWLAGILSLALTFAACQTTGAQDQQSEKQKNALEAQKGLVRTALDSGKPESALQTLREMIREHPEDASIQNLMGLAQLALKNADRATRHFRMAYKLDPQPSIGLNLSSAYIEAGDPAKAVTLLRAMLKPGKDKKPYEYKERLYHNLGYAYLRQNQLTKAQQWFQEALDENPAFFPTYLEMAHIYEKTKRPALAMKSYRQSIDYCHVCFEPVQSLSMMYMKSGRQDEARQLLLSYSKVDGVSTPDKLAAEHLLRVVTTAGLPPRRAG